MKHPREQSFIKDGLLYKAACPGGPISFNFARFLTSVPLPGMIEPGNEEGEKVGTEGMQARCRHGRVGLKELSGGGRGGWVGPARPGRIIVLLTKTGPQCISFPCKITVSLAQGAVHDAEADVADPVFVRITIRRTYGGHHPLFLEHS